MDPFHNRGGDDCNVSLLGRALSADLDLSPLPVTPLLEPRCRPRPL